MKSRRLFASIFVAILFFFAVQNAGLLIGPFRSALQPGEDSGFVRFRDDMQKAFQSNALYMKSAFIDLNGVASKWMGKRVINGTILLKNDMLAFDDEEYYPMEELAEHLTGLHDGLAEKGIPFLYVQMPHKPDMNEELLPVGIQSEGNWNADLLLRSLDENGIMYLDLRDGLSRNAEEIERYFFKTDHHWNFDGAFIGFSRIVQTLQGMLRDGTDISMYTDAENWKKYRIQKPFLGTLGVRVGQYVVGMDQVEYYIPEFETNMSCMIHDMKMGIHSDFEQVLTRGQEINMEEGHYTKNAYMVYLGSDRPLVSHRNAQAPVKKKLLLIKDSFSIPIQAFMSTVYSEIDVIDKRHYKECSIIEYAMRMQPDAVIMAASPRTFADAFYYDYGYEAKSQIEEDMAPSELILQEKTVRLNDTEDLMYMLHSGFQNDTVYTLEFESASASVKNIDFLTASLVEPQSGGQVFSRVFDLQYDREEKRSVWTFRTPKENADDLNLMISVGQQDQTDENSIIVENIRLWKGAV